MWNLLYQNCHFGPSKWYKRCHFNLVSYLGYFTEVSLSPFWFNMAPFNKIKDGNVTYTIAGDEMEDLYEFSDQVVERTTNHSVNISTLDPNLYYCAIAWLNAASGYQYRYPVLIFQSA